MIENGWKLLERTVMRVIIGSNWLKMAGNG